MNTRRFERSGEVALSGTPERTASRTADAVPSRGEDASFFLTDIFNMVTDSQLALDGNYDRVRCLSHVGREGCRADRIAGGHPLSYARCRVRSAGRCATFIRKYGVHNQAWMTTVAESGRNLPCRHQ